MTHYTRLVSACANKLIGKSNNNASRRSRQIRWKSAGLRRDARADRLGVCGLDDRGSHHKTARRQSPLANASTNNLSKDGQLRGQWIFWKGMARMLETVDLTRKMDRECYLREVSRRQIQLRGLGYQVYLQKQPVIIAFEIWDAAGKGGAIKRVIATNGELMKKPWRKCW